MKPDEHPKGTLVILLIFLVLAVITWLGIYSVMIARGGIS
jgi:hypothetical protein